MNCRGETLTAIGQPKSGVVAGRDLQHFHPDRRHQPLLLGDRDPFRGRMQAAVVPPAHQRLHADPHPRHRVQHGLVVQLELIPIDGRVQQAHGARTADDAVAELRGVQLHGSSRQLRRGQRDPGLLQQFGGRGGLGGDRNTGDDR